MTTLTRHTESEPAWRDWFTSRSFPDMMAMLPRWFDDSHMRIEEFRDDDELVVRAEMPGIDPDDDVEITVSDGMLTIRAERTEEEETDDKKGYRSEFHYGSFTRSMRLPAGATVDDITADYTDGILEVHIPLEGDHADEQKIPVSRR